MNSMFEALKIAAGKADGMNPLARTLKETVKTDSEKRSDWRKRIQDEARETAFSLAELEREEKRDLEIEKTWQAYENGTTIVRPRRSRPVHRSERLDLDKMIYLGE